MLLKTADPCFSRKWAYTAPSTETWALPLSQSAEWSAEVEAREMMGGSGVVEANSLFVACPRCSAWPMAANVTVLNWRTVREVRFRCPRCDHQVTALLMRAQAAPRTTHAEAETTVDFRG